MAHARTWFLLLCVLLVGGCAQTPIFADPIQSITDHPRIVYQSLVPVTAALVNPMAPAVVCPSPSSTEPMLGPPAPSKTDPLVRPPSVVTAPPSPPWFVPFVEGQFHVAPDFAGWQAVRDRLDPAFHYVVVGLADSQEEDGPLLALRRAEYIAGLLYDAQVPRTHVRTLASWTQQTVSLHAARGVHIYLVTAESDAPSVIQRVVAHPLLKERT